MLTLDPVPGCSSWNDNLNFNDDNADSIIKQIFTVFT